jgi:hypothetical protein
MTRRLYILDPAMVGMLGHTYDYARLVAERARLAGFEPVMVVRHGVDFSEDHIGAKLVPFFAEQRMESPSGEQQGLGLTRLLPKQLGQLVRRLTEKVIGAKKADQAKIAEAQVFVADFRRWLDQTTFRPDDIIFLPTLSWAEASLAARAVQFFEDNADKFGKEIPQTRLMLRFDPPRAHLGRAFMSQSNKARSVVWVSDTDLLAQVYRKILGKTVVQVVLPIDTALLRPKRHKRPNEPLVVSFLGETREEKGFPFVVDGVVRMLQERDAGEFRFVVQVAAIPTEPEAVAAIQRLTAFRSDALTLIEGGIDSEAFHELLNETDIVLAPYAPESYRLRSSGIIANALASGCSILALEGPSWINQILRYEVQSGQAVLIQKSIDDFVEGLRVLAGNIRKQGPLPLKTVAFDKSAPNVWEI